MPGILADTSTIGLQTLPKPASSSIDDKQTAFEVVKPSMNSRLTSKLNGTTSSTRQNGAPAPGASLTKDVGDDNASLPDLEVQDPTNPSTEDFLKKYTDARKQVHEDLGTFREHLDVVLRLLDTQVHIEDFDKIFTNNQCARQYNAAITDRTVTPLAALMDRKGQVVSLTKEKTIEDLENLTIDEKQQILQSLGGDEQPVHASEDLVTRQVRVAMGLPAAPVAAVV